MISNDNEIQMYLSCALCFVEERESSLSCGWTDIGLQVWCEKHGCNVVHIDFEGQTHPANDLRKPEDSNVRHFPV